VVVAARGDARKHTSRCARRPRSLPRRPEHARSYGTAAAQQVNFVVRSNGRMQAIQSLVARVFSYPMPLTRSARKAVGTHIPIDFPVKFDQLVECLLNSDF